MKYVVFDTETTGTNPRTAELLEFGAIKFKCDDNGIDLKSIQYTDQYFYIDHEVPAGARNVNGLTQELLAKYSNGDYLEDKIDTLREFIYDPEVCMVNYNSGYDMTVMECNLQRSGLPSMKYKSNVDIMKLCKVNNRAVKLAIARQNHILVNESYDNYMKMYTSLFGKTLRSHSALSDTYDTWRLLLHFMMRGVVKDGFIR